MPTRAIVIAINHLLAGERWARERLHAFAGQHFRIAAGPLALALTIDGEGYVRSGGDSAGVEPAVTVELPGDTPWRFIFDRKSIFAAARLSGSADFAETLAFVFRNLRWDVEADLARIVGDIAARRLVRSGDAVLAWQKKAAGNALANLAEYLAEEKAAVLGRREMDAFRADIEALRAALANMDKRLARL